MQSSLPAGWLAFTGRELNPLDRYKRFQIIHPPFLDLAWRKGSFIAVPLCSAGSFDHLVGTSPHSGTVAGFVGSDTWITRYLSGCSMLALREMACNALGGS